MWITLLHTATRAVHSRLKAGTKVAHTRTLTRRPLASLPSLETFLKVKTEALSLAMSVTQNALKKEGSGFGAAVWARLQYYWQLLIEKYF